MELKTILGGSIHTNSYLLTEEKEAIVFDYVPETAQFLKEQKLHVDFICLTHIHFDHFEGLRELLVDYPDIKVFVSEEAKININNPAYTLNYSASTCIDSERIFTLKGEEEIEWKGSKITVLKTPGHSIDSLAYFIDALNCIITGDLIFFRSVGRTDFLGGDQKVLMDSIEKLFQKYPDSTVLYPGHGPKTTIGGEKKHNPFF